MHAAEERDKKNKGHRLEGNDVPLFQPQSNRNPLIQAAEDRDKKNKGYWLEKMTSYCGDHNPTQKIYHWKYMLCMSRTTHTHVEPLGIVHFRRKYSNTTNHCCTICFWRTNRLQDGALSAPSHTPHFVGHRTHRCQ